MTKISNLSFSISIVIIILSLFASSFGIAFPSLYANESVKLAADFRGQDFATLLIAIPLFTYSLLSARKGSVRGILMRLGILVFFIYQYLQYSVGTAFNYLYFIYIMIFSLSFVALAIGIIELDLDRLKRCLAYKFPLLATAICEMTLAVMLAVMWISKALERYYSGIKGHLDRETSVMMIEQTMDLGFLVPIGLSAGCFLLMKKIAGFILTGMTMIGSICLLSTFISARIASQMKEIEVPLEEQIFGYGGMLILLFFTYKFYKSIPEK